MGGQPYETIRTLFPRCSSGLRRTHSSFPICITHQLSRDIIIMEKFDLIQNCIIIDGLVHTLTTKDEEPNISECQNPCEMCSLNTVCKTQEGHLCNYFDATQEEYFTQKAYVRISFSIDFYNL